MDRASRRAGTCAMPDRGMTTSTLLSGVHSSGKQNECVYECVCVCVCVSVCETQRVIL